MLKAPTALLHPATPDKKTTKLPKKHKKVPRIIKTTNNIILRIMSHGIETKFSCWDHDQEIADNQFIFGLDKKKSKHKNKFSLEFLCTSNYTSAPLLLSI